MLARTFPSFLSGLLNSCPQTWIRWLSLLWASVRKEMARYTISGPSPSVVDSPYLFNTFQLTPSLGYMGLWTAIPLALLQLETHLRQGYQSSTRWMEWWADYRKLGAPCFNFCYYCCCRYGGSRDQWCISTVNINIQHTWSQNRRWQVGKWSLMGGPVIENLTYSRRESKQTAQERATWSDNGSIVDRLRVHLLKDREIMLQDNFGTRSHRVVTFLILAVLWGKKSYLHSSQINRAASKKILDLPRVSSPNLQDPRF